MNRSALPCGSIFLALLLCVSAVGVLAEGLPAAEDDSDLAIIPPDADNVEIHEVKMVDGVFQEDHPVIMYKEDFVTEDKVANTGAHHKKHHKTHRHAEPAKSEEKKIYFDILPDEPIVLNSDLKTGPVSNQDAIQLVKPVKEEWLMKYPKKYQSHSRQRRQAYLPSLYYHSPYAQNNIPPIYYVSRLPVAGKKPTYLGKNPNWPKKEDRQPVSVGSRDDFLFHNSDPSQADFSVFDQARPTTPSSSAPPRGNSNSINDGEPPSRPSRPSSPWITSAPPGSPQLSTVRPVVGLPTLRPTVQQPPTSGPKVTSCVWAIVNCCTSGSRKIRYSCFEEFGCNGAFWDINPCADQSVLDAEGILEEAFPLAASASFPSSASASATRPAAPARPSCRQDTLQYPKEYDYQAGSKCHRASQLCCSLRNLASTYDCFQYHGCDQSLSNIISGCS
ncbi:uncharacterized protein Dana_GF17997, isoform C [Drosophila ananassae]|uniref:Uncharacterized protein, isoform B n=2 Tax=Drosophila ananassae TaxID=7217 RepID=A0A0P9APZ8_DROAN|nr:uncharacterized protein LOC6500776 isoform X2 [Drosophila ananassae]XP_014766710.1 uncharacterized protein LOC6500776 isoform X2 [Drosophila ananassae]KPU79728.1 uncharacterized protein Dana_GF17997, isoform B [Drosophila ananassae]KPU79729.1 uncharacterized protein Dana_GF17997, isoform C [Drosophila ananassae]